ncbi:MAG: hypothetical protein ACYC0V_14140, partial [Armatimonadota bacterium]
MKRIDVIFFTILVIICVASLTAHAGYPKIANLWGCDPASTEYDVWSKYDMLITSGGSFESYSKFVSEVRSCNPQILIFGTAPFVNVASPAQSPWMKDEWYLHRSNGTKVSWWVDQLYAPNIFNDDYLKSALDHIDNNYGP